MWLINTSTFQLHYHNSPDEKEYIILSHTWGTEEVTFQDMRILEKARLKKGFAKIEGVCSLARERRITRAWVDTCCIDKTSSAELTESINSMFRWYKEASVCVAFLQDLEPGNDVTGIVRCKWFTRGWTLQEMIAPASVRFYDSEWNFRGTKTTLSKLILEATGVNAEVLESPDIIYTLPVGRRMSWAANRETTRIEDRAYSLLGIFDVNMALIYGEGDKAFLRLQETIAREMDDLSLLAWISEEPKENFRGAFAKSPAEFFGCGKLVNIDNPIIEAPSFTVTNKGLQIHASLNMVDPLKLADLEDLSTQTIVTETKSSHYTLNLDCTNEGYPDRILVICLVKTSRGFVRQYTNVQYSRTQLFMSSSVPPGPVIILKQIRPTDYAQVKNRLSHSFAFRIEEWSPAHTTASHETPKHLWDKACERFLSGGHELFTGFVEISTEFAPGRYSRFFVLCGLLRVPHAERPGENGSIIRKESQIEPWAVIMDRVDEPDLCGMIDDAKEDAFALNSLGYIIRSHIIEGEPGNFLSREKAFYETPSSGSKRYEGPHGTPVMLAEMRVETIMKRGIPEHTVVVKLEPVNQRLPRMEEGLGMRVL
jgi:hypothetical protein